MTVTAPRPTAGGAPPPPPDLRSRDRGRVAKEVVFQALVMGSTGVGLLVLAWLLVDVGLLGGPRLDLPFLNDLPSRRAESAGVGVALRGTLILMGVTAAIAIPLSIGAAVYLEELAPEGRVASKITKAVEVNISNLAGVPSIIYGILAFLLFGRYLGLGNSLLTGGIALALLVSPVIIVAAREALKAVPPSVREGSYALGGTRMQTLFRATLPPALGGMVTGCILALSRAIGEAAPLLLAGALAFTAVRPTWIDDPTTALPIQVFNWTSRPQSEFQVTAAAGILVLLGILLTMNAIAVVIRNRSQVKW